MTDARRTIAIFGAGKAKPDDESFRRAHDLGRALAQAGFDIVNGGYGGVMLASARGARQAGGRVTGVTCRAFKHSGPNEYITDEISTDTLEERLRTLVQLGDGYVVLPGGTGTLLELADVWEHRCKGFAGVDKPIILLGDFWRPLAAVMEQADPRSRQAIEIADTIEEVIQTLKEVLR